MTRKEMFRVKPYAHLNYKFVVRAKLDGKWRRSYFKSEEEATAYARDQNAAASQQIDPGDRSSNAGPSDSPSKNVAGGALNQRLAISSPTGARKAVVILGMHRSGTSALCGALDLVGVDFGNHLMPANDANVKGYWEHEEVVRFHDDLLASLGSRWDDDKPLPSDWVKREIARDVRALLIGVLERDFAHRSLFGIKDPRMCRLMPLWFPIFQAMRVEPHFVLVVRHPWEVAESLAKRDGIEHPKSYLLWLEHVVQAEVATRGHKRSFIRYEEMVDDPVAVLGELRKQLGVNLRAPSRVRTSLRNFLDPSLRHHQLNETAGKLRQPVPQLALDLYETIRNASTSREIGRKVEPLVAQFIRGRELFYPRIDLVEAELVLHLQHEFEEKAKHVVLLQGDLEKKSQQVAQFQEELEEKSKQVAQFKTEAEEGSRHAAQLQRVNEQQSQLLERLKNQLEISDDRLARAKDELLDARWEALTLRGTLVRRTESPKTSASRVLELESRVEAALSERDQLRTMLTSLQNDLEQERLMGQTKQGELRATQDQLKATQVQLNATQGQLKTMGKDLRSEQKQMDRLRESISRKLILPFGKSQRKLQQLTASRRADD